ncbi:EMB1270 [Symbiodinium natans]|uniref:EMB1270 protein n=1 Tax=Symbiodinium natans TaxID=878477 RepID=A0A812LYH6_9DINO|nr:EMB1270 [Symbiodinium natans]
MEDPRTSAPPPNSISFNVGISACEQGSRWLLALELLDTMEAGRLRVDVVAASAALAALGAAGMVHRAKRLFRKARWSQIDPNAVSFGSMISACEKSSDWRGSLDYLRASWIQRLADESCHNAALAACSRAVGGEADRVATRAEADKTAAPSRGKLLELLVPQP